MVRIQMGVHVSRLEGLAPALLVIQITSLANPLVSITESATPYFESPIMCYPTAEYGTNVATLPGYRSLEPTHKVGLDPILCSWGFGSLLSKPD